MAEDKSLFKRLDDIAAGQAEILSEVVGVKTQVGSTDNRIAELEAEVRRLKNQPQQNTQAVQPQPPRELSEREILHQFLKPAKKSWRWFGNKAEFNKWRKLAIISLVLLLSLGVISTIVSSICFQIYSTFTLFENIWLIFGIFYLVYAVRTQQTYEVNSLAANSSYKYRRDDLGMMFPGKEKFVFRLFRWLAVIAVICNVVCIWTMGHDLKALATILEVLFLGAILFAFFMNLNLYAQYSIIYVEGHNLTTKERVVLVLPPGAKDLMLEEDFKKKMPFFYE